MSNGSKKSKPVLFATGRRCLADLEILWKEIEDGSIQVNDGDDIDAKISLIQTIASTHGYFETILDRLEEDCEESKHKSDD